MIINLIDEKNVLVELSEEDLSKNEMTYEQLDYSNIKTKNFVRKVLESVRAETGNSVFASRSLEVDVMPSDSGGCLMVFTETEPENEPTSETNIFFAENIDDMLDFARVFSSLKKPCRSALFKGEDGRYFLLFKDHEKTNRTLALEFLEPLELSGLESEAFLEHTQCVLRDFALEALSGESL